MPAQKKHASTRRRANKASTAATLHADGVELIHRSGWTAAQLRVEIDRRNADRGDDEKLSKAGGKAGMRATLEADDSEIPELPEKAYPWHKLTEQWWIDVWSSPMSAEWHPDTDFHNVLAAALHYDDMWWAGDAGARQKAHAAYLKTVAPLGLTPYDRRRLEWTIEGAEEAKYRGRRRRGEEPGKQPAKKQENRQDPRLTVVS